MQDKLLTTKCNSFCRQPVVICASWLASLLTLAQYLGHTSNVTSVHITAICMEAQSGNMPNQAKLIAVMCPG